MATALILGGLHAFDPDHLAAVTAFIARRPAAGTAVGFAIRWGLGHSLTLAAAGIAASAFRLVVSAGLQTAAELAVGVMLVGVGSWVLAGLRRGGDPSHHEAHHTPRPAVGSIFWVGALHGLAGSAGLLVIIPVGLMDSAWAVLAYILAFSGGVISAMALYAMAIGGLFGKVAGGAGARWYPWLAGAAGSSALLLGLGWISFTLLSRAAS
jgi:hypothetical protein